MFDIVFYKNRSGKEPVLEYIQELSGRTDKDSRVKLQKVHDYINYLKTEGKKAGEPYVKHIEGEIWELRPLRDRILFAAFDGQKFVLLHHFVKKTRKIPQSEVEQAKRNLADFKERYSHER